MNPQELEKMKKDVRHSLGIYEEEDYSEAEKKAFNNVKERLEAYDLDNPEANETYLNIAVNYHSTKLLELSGQRTKAENLDYFHMNFGNHEGWLEHERKIDDVKLDEGRVGSELDDWKKSLARRESELEKTRKAKEEYLAHPEKYMTDDEKIAEKELANLKKEMDSLKNSQSEVNADLSKEKELYGARIQKLTDAGYDFKKNEDNYSKYRDKTKEISELEFHLSLYKDTSKYDIFKQSVDEKKEELGKFENELDENTRDYVKHRYMVEEAIPRKLTRINDAIMGTDIKIMDKDAYLKGQKNWHELDFDTKEQEKSVSAAKEKVDNLEKELAGYTKNRENLENIASSMAENYFISEQSDCTKFLSDADVFRRMNKDLHHVKADFNKNQVVKAVSTVKNAYDLYHNNHNAFARFFRFIPGTSAHKDYADYESVRDTFLGYVGNKVDAKSLNAYMDSGNLDNFKMDLNKTINSNPETKITEPVQNKEEFRKQIDISEEEKNISKKENEVEKFDVNTKSVDAPENVSQMN